MPLRNLLLLFVAAVVSLACYQRAAKNRYVGTLAEAMNLIDDHYVDPVDDRELFEGAMIGMLDRLDPYSSYTNPKDYKRFNEGMSQQFYGIGIMVEINPDTKRLTVMNPLPDSPAQKAGIMPGDVILKIGDLDTKDMTLEKSVQYMRGEVEGIDRHDHHAARRRQRAPRADAEAGEDSPRVRPRRYPQHHRPVGFSPGRRPPASGCSASAPSAS